MWNIDPVTADIDRLEDIFLQCRSFFPTLSKTLIGKTSFATADYYRSLGHNVFIQTGKPITEDFIDRFLRIGKWANENAIIRLYGIMQYHGLLKKIDREVEGWKEVDLMRRMRNILTKTKLQYRPNDQENIRLRKELINHFKLNPDQFPEGEIPTPIDKVIQPIFEGCRLYAQKRRSHL